nr:unnamed protein product [Callosobruchus analis]
MDHIRNKEIVRKLKDGDKEKAEVDKSISVSCFDLQKVILVPQCERPPFYYKCKLSTYNFTVFDVNSKEGFCYIWTEQIAKRGGNEIASCLFDFIETMVKRGKQKFYFYSDNCIGQNKNKILVMMYLFATKKFQIEIVHRFFEAGHSQNENDSIHALIERNKQGKDIFTPEQFIMLVKLAKVKGKPYNVKEMCQTDFFDFKSLEVTYKNFQWNTGGKKVSWLNIREIKVDFKSPESLKIRNDLYKDEEDIINVHTGKSTKRVRTLNETTHRNTLTRAYDKLLPLGKKKYNHLKFLATKVPDMYKPFYDTLTCHDRSDSEDSD